MLNFPAFLIWKFQNWIFKIKLYEKSAHYLPKIAQSLCFHGIHELQPVESRLGIPAQQTILYYQTRHAEQILVCRVRLFAPKIDGALKRTLLLG